MAIQFLLHGVTLGNPDTARQAAHGLYNGTVAALTTLHNAARPSTGAGGAGTSSSLPTGVCSLSDVATGLLSVVKLSVDTVLSTVVELHRADDTTCVLVCRCARLLLSGYVTPVSLSSDASVPVACVNRVLAGLAADERVASLPSTTVPVGTRSGTGTPAGDRTPRSRAASGADHDDDGSGGIALPPVAPVALTPAVLLSRAFAAAGAVALPGAALRPDLPGKLMTLLLQFVEDKRAGVALEAVRCVCEVGWQAVQSVRTALTSIAGRVQVRVVSGRLVFCLLQRHS